MPETASTIPIKIAELINLPLGVQDITISEKENIMFALLNDMDLTSRVDAFFSNITFPWEKKKEAQVTVGAIIAYQITKESNGTYSFTKLWVKSYAEQTSAFCWSPSLKILSIAMDDGKVNCIRIDPGKNYAPHEDVYEYCYKIYIVLQFKIT